MVESIEVSIIVIVTPMAIINQPSGFINKFPISFN